MARVWSSPGEKCVGSERGYDDQVVQHGGEGWQKKVPVGLKNAGPYRADAIEDELKYEDPEEEHRDLQLLPGFCRGEFLGTLPVRGESNQRLGENDAENGDPGQQRQCHGKEGVGQGLSVLLAVVRDPLYQNRDKDGVENAA